MQPKVRTVGQIERLPKWLLCIPLVSQWLWLSLRHLSFSLPSAANAYITCGGIVGEGKLEYFECMGNLAKNKTADYFSVNAGAAAFHIAIERMQEKALRFPVIVKPNLGWCGYGVRLIANSAELKLYLDAFPKAETVIVQRYIPEPGEAGIYYARDPDEGIGKVTGVTLRYHPQVTGDGIHTIRQLMAGDERLRRAGSNMLHRPVFDPDAVLPNGEKIRLATIGSTRVGGLYCDGSQYITPALHEAVDAIARDMKDFHIGRFDMRFESLEKLSKGQGLTIMEVNGAGSEAVHAWDPKYSIAESYRIIFAKQRLLFRIGAANRRKGHKPSGLFKLAKLHFRQQALIKRYPLSN